MRACKRELSSPNGSGVDALKSQVEWQGAYVRKLKEELGRSNSDPTVQAQVQILLDLQRKLGSLNMKQQKLRRIGRAEEAEAMSASNEISEDTTTATPQSMDDWLDSMPTKGNNKVSLKAAYLQNQPAHQGQTGKNRTGKTPTPTPKRERRPKVPSQAGKKKLAVQKYATWQMLPVPMFFVAERPVAKAFAKAVAEGLQLHLIQQGKVEDKEPVVSRI
eukprot:gene23370-30631_t